MQAFRTILPPEKGPFEITHQDALLLIGSCFTEHIGAYLQDRKFNTTLNPYGIVYNPLSMAEALQALLQGDALPQAEALFLRDELWHSWAHHSQFSHTEQQEALRLMQAAYTQGSEALHNCTRLLLTLGSADVFELAESGRVVANNHKMPSAYFRQRRLSVAEITEALGSVLERLHARRPTLRVVLSVSPVRHLRGGLIANQRSKASLLLACEVLEKQFDFVHYFPAYELLTDDLRDYRFYAADMIHPSEMAVEYVWEYFQETYFPAPTKALCAELAQLKRAAAHRPFFTNTSAWRTFVAAQRAKIAQLQKAHPMLDFSGEIRHFAE